jgi:citrate lyase subunit beta / citryl-CoA lyase
MRSLLFVPGDDLKKIEKALASEADALIFDLEDSVAPSRKVDARAVVQAALAAADRSRVPRLIVRINALTSAEAGADLDAILPGAPAAILLPKCRDGADIQHLAALLAVREAENALADGQTRILAIATEVPAALFALGTLRGASNRLEGLAWGGEDLASSLGAIHNRDEYGHYTDPYRLARSLALFAAGAAEIAAIDSVFTDFRNFEGLKTEAMAAQRDGFTGKMAIHPAQIPIINAVFTPDAASIAAAQKVVAAFAAHPDAGVLAQDGKMLDRPHLVQAERLLARAAFVARSR